MFCLESKRIWARGPWLQSGMTLLEVMVGLVIGLLAMASAVQTLNALQMAQAESSQRLSLQADARNTLNNIAREIHMAGSAAWAGRETLDLTSPNAPAITIAQAHGQATLSARYATPQSASHVGCLWRATAGLGPQVISTYTVRDNTLRCSVNTGTAQPLMDRVAEFSLAFAVQDANGLRWHSGATTGVQEVRGVALCLHVFSAPVPSAALTADSGCDHQPIAADGRLHWVERRVISLQSGWTL